MILAGQSTPERKSPAPGQSRQAALEGLSSPALVPSLRLARRKVVPRHAAPTPPDSVGDNSALLKGVRLFAIFSTGRWISTTSGPPPVANGMHHGEVDATLAAYGGADGKILNSIFSAMPLDLNDGDYGELLRTGLPFMMLVLILALFEGLKWLKRWLADEPRRRMFADARLLDALLETEFLDFLELVAAGKTEANLLTASAQYLLTSPAAEIADAKKAKLLRQRGYRYPGRSGICAPTARSFPMPTLLTFGVANPRHLRQIWDFVEIVSRNRQNVIENSNVGDAAANGHRISPRIASRIDGTSVNPKSVHFRFHTWPHPPQKYSG